MCQRLGTDPATFWPQLRNRVHSYADLRPELVGAVERLIDFVAPPERLTAAGRRSVAAGHRPEIRVPASVSGISVHLMAQAVTRGPVSGTATRTRKRKPFLLDLYSTAVGKKYVMAITGHHRHRLRRRPHGRQPEDVPRGDRPQRRAAYDIDIYGEFLRELLVPILPRTYVLWALRLVLIGALVLHLHAAYSLTIMNRRARPVKYQSKRDYVVADFATRTMRWTGIIVLLFLVLAPRRLHVGLGQPGLRARRRRTATSTPASSRLPVAILYIVANIALGIHLFHGTWSLFQSIGLEQPTLQHVAPRPRHRHRHDHRGRQRLVPDRRPGRHRPI